MAGLAQAITDDGFVKSTKEIADDLRKLLGAFLQEHKERLLKFDHNERAVPARIAALEAKRERLSSPEREELGKLGNYMKCRVAHLDKIYSEPFAALKGCSVEEARRDLYAFMAESLLLDRVATLKSWREVHDIIATTDADDNVISAIRGVKRLTIEEYDAACERRSSIRAEAKKRDAANAAIAEGREDWEPYDTALAEEKFPKLFLTRDSNGDPFYWEARKGLSYKIFREIEKRLSGVRSERRATDVVRDSRQAAKKKFPSPLGNLIFDGKVGVTAVSQYMTFDGDEGETVAYMIFDCPGRNKLRVLEVVAEGCDAEALKSLEGHAFPFTPHPRRPHLEDRAMNEDVREIVKFTLRLR